MWKEGIVPVLTDQAALTAVLARIDSLAQLGCGVVRFAVPDMPSADALNKIAGGSSLPVVADIHFDYRLALRCLEGDVAKIRINPGNIGSAERVRAVAERCREKGVPIRIGVNTGSLPADVAVRVQGGDLDRAEALVETALREAAALDALNFQEIIVSIKASGGEETVRAARLFSSRSDIPLHIGVTEAGPLIGGIVRSTWAICTLLNEGIGDTVRVSLSSSPENEVIAGRAMLQEAGKRTGGVTLVSCPRCGREGFDVHGFMERWERRLYGLKADITVAVMGCPVNGPGEAKHADIGITGGGGTAVIFRHGAVVKRVPAAEADQAFAEALDALIV
jgi:(E)-4-hydroxy-3-methylbut-2-enyl-diphosphate synthase